MGNATTFPGDGIFKGNLRVQGVFSPTMARADLLANALIQPFTVPMSIWRKHDGYAGDLPVNMTPGTGISTGTGTVCNGHVVKMGDVAKTEIFIDLTGLNSGSDIGDIIGKTLTANCHIGEITAAKNGTIVYGQITCLETPAGGDPDVDFYGTVTENTGTQDAAISALTGEVQLLNNGDWTGAPATPIAMTALPGVGHLYMVDAGDTAATYTAGQFLIELWGTVSVDNHLECVGGTHGTNAPSLQTPDFGGNAAAANYYARGELQIPWEYIAGQTVTLRLHAGMLTTVADQACTVDLQVYKSDEDETSTGDLCATAAQSMNSLTFADLDFTITPTTLSPGDLLDVRINVSADDNGDAGVMKACIGSVQLLCDVR